LLGLAELLSPIATTLKCLEPFKFIMIDDDDYQRPEPVARLTNVG